MVKDDLLQAARAYVAANLDAFKQTEHDPEEIPFKTIWLVEEWSQGLALSLVDEAVAVKDVIWGEVFEQYWAPRMFGKMSGEESAA